MKKLPDQAKIGFHLGEKSIVPNEDFLWKDFRGLYDYIKETASTVNKLIDIIEKQDIEIDKLKRHVSNRVQKIEIVNFDDFLKMMLKMKEDFEKEHQFPKKKKEQSF